MTKVYVLTHAKCSDGEGAEFAARVKYGDSATYIPVKYNEPPPEMESGSEVYIADFSYDRETLLALADKASKIQVLDHHLSAQRALEDLPFAKFDMEKSGAVLAWEYFHPGVPIPQILLHIQDRDLWNWKLPDTNKILLGLQVSKNGSHDWDKFDIEELKRIGTGADMLEQRVAKDQSTPENVRIITLFGYKVGVTNETRFSSTVGNYIYENLPVDFSMTYSISSDLKCLLSFRAKKGSDVDVSLVAKQFGGGGHKASAGAIISLLDLTPILLNAHERYLAPLGTYSELVKA